MRKLLLQIFTWWRGQTLGVRFYTWRYGKRVGEDETGNVYYQTHDGARRWVIYRDLVEASQIPPGWHGWIHHKTNQPPVNDQYEPLKWQLPHQANQTGSAGAYRPAIANKALTSKQMPSHYEAWKP